MVTEEKHNNAPEGNPYDAPVGNEEYSMSIEGRRIFPAGYWILWWALIVMSVLLTPVTQGLGAFAAITFFAGWIRDAIFSRRQYRSGLANHEAQFPSDKLPARFLISSAIGVLISIAAPTLFVITCVPLSLVGMASMEGTGGSSTAASAFVVLASTFSAGLSFLISFLVLRGVAGKARSFWPPQ